MFNVYCKKLYSINPSQGGSFMKLENNSIIFIHFCIQISG